MKHYTFITGASSGIGYATALRLAKDGRNLILVARRKNRLEALKKAIIAKNGVDVIVKQLDVTNRKAVDRLFDWLKDHRIDAVVNNAGLALGTESIDEVSAQDNDTMIGVNILAFTRIAQASISLLKKTKGHLINLGSIAGLEVYPGGAVYCGTKHYVHAVSRGIRLDTLGSGMRVTEICPGRVETEFSVVRFKGDTEKAKAVYEGYEPLVADDIADVIAYALNAPPHVNIEHVLIVPTAQAGMMTAKKS